MTRELDDNGWIDRDEVVALFPNLGSTHIDTKFTLFVQVFPRSLEIQVYYREPYSATTMAIYADMEKDKDSDNIQPHELSITYWGPSEQFR